MDIPALPPVPPRALRQPSAAGGEAALRRAARDFEAQAFAMLLQPIFATADLSRSPFGGGAAEAQWQPLLVEAYAAAATRAGAGLRIAEHVLRALQRAQPSALTPNTGETAP
jgi:flagellar protein FlgJ